MRLAGAVDIGGTRTKLGVVADDGRIVSRATVPTSRDAPAVLVSAIGTALRPMLADAARAAGTGFTGGAPVGVGVSVAGFLDATRSVMSNNANLTAFEGFPLRRALEEQLDGFAIVLEVDSNAAVIAEHRFGAGRGVRRLLGVTIGTGLGGGVILDGELLRHTGQCAGDLGHIIVSPGGRACSCGAHGCLEAMVCSAAVTERAGGRTVRDVIAAARSGAQRSIGALAETAHWLGIGLASLAPLFAPDTVVIGGGVGAAGDLLLEPARVSFRQHASSIDAPRVQIVVSGFDGWEAMIGAASALFEPVP